MLFEIRTEITYNNSAAHTGWVKLLGSRLDKQQATVQLIVHANGLTYTYLFFFFFFL